MGMSLFNNKSRVLFPSYSDFVEQYLNALYKTAFHLTGNQLEAEDLVQNLVIKLQPRFLELRGLEKPLLWMNKVLYRMFIDSYRKAKHTPVTNLSQIASADEHSDYLDSFTGVEESPQAIVEKAELILQLQNALYRLHDDARALIVLYEIEGYTINEIHEITGLPSGAIKSKLLRARIQLRSLLKNETDSPKTLCIADEID